MKDVRCLKQHLESTLASVHVSQDFRLHRCQTCLLAEGLSRMRRGTRVWWAEWSLYKSDSSQEHWLLLTSREGALLKGQADKLVSSLVPFCSSPAADCWVCLCINEVVICLKEQLVGLPGELLPPAWWLRCRCQQPGRWWQIKKENSHRASGDFLTNMLIHTLADWLTLPKYLSFTAMFGRDFIATLVVCDLAHFMHELLWLLLAAHLLTTTAGLQGLTSGHFTWLFSFSVRHKWVFTSHLSAAASNWTLMDFDRN